MNNISKTIGWADLSWNPIKGLCPVGCWYCYARAIYKRFKLDPTPRLDYTELYSAMRSRGHLRRIFVCSTFDLFHPVADQWREEIFRVIKYREDNTFVILTKLPERIDRPMPPNVWLGVSVTGVSDDWQRIDTLKAHQAKVRFVSYEPCLAGPILPKLCGIDWLIVGRLTGHGKKYDPTPDNLDAIRRIFRYEKRPLFEKSNLAGLVDGALVQEWPR
jgi:protein gp37